MAVDASGAPVTKDAGPPHDAAPHGKAQGFWALALGALGVVFGDIGTSPLYAMREALSHTRGNIALQDSVLGVVSLMLWTLTLIVTVKYVIFLMRADNKGEGGTLALMALAQRAIGTRSRVVFILGVIGAALFYGDAMITPAMSVLSAIEGVQTAPGVGPGFGAYVPAIAGGIYNMAGNVSIFRALNPWYGIHFLIENGLVGFIILGSVFLAVTGAEALYADMGHFGRQPIRVAWLLVAFPCLALNYMGQGALVLQNPQARMDPFWTMVPSAVYWPVLILATAATVIASQAVITGAFSLTQQAVQLRLLPRLDIKRTSETQAGQIFVPAVNTFLMIGVLTLLVMFRNSHNLASAYGIAVTGAMFVDTLLAYVVIRRIWNWKLWQTALLLVPLATLDIAFITSNLLKIPDGAWLPLAFALAMMALMYTWTRGTEILAEKTRRDSVPLNELIEILRARPPHRTAGTAIFLTSEADVAPVALMHNLKHNKVLHKKNVILSVKKP